MKWIKLSEELPPYNKLIVPTHDNVGLPTPKVIGDKWEYWCLLPERP